MKVMWDRNELIKLIKEHGGQITPEKLFELLKGSDTIVVDIAESGDHLEIHLDGDVIATLDRALLTPLALSEFKLVGVNPIASKKGAKKSANASEQLNLGLDSSLHIDNGKLCSLIPSGNNLPSGRFTGELFILNVDVGQVLKGIYKYNGSLWEKVADIGGSETKYYHMISFQDQVNKINGTTIIINNNSSAIDTITKLYDSLYDEEKERYPNYIANGMFKNDDATSHIIYIKRLSTDKIRFVGNNPNAIEQMTSYDFAPSSLTGTMDVNDYVIKI